MDSTQSNDENDSENTPPKKKIRLNTRRPQKFRDSWLSEQDFGKWLTRDSENPFKAKCKLCSASLTAEIAVIRNHAKSRAHLSKCSVISNQTPINKYITSIQNIDSSSSKAVNRAEIKLCGLMLEHNISFYVMNHLTEVLKDIFSDSEIAKKVQLKVTKSKAIVKNVIGETEKEILCNKLKNNVFSILIDESTDVSAVQTMCIVVRFYDADEGQVVSRFWDLVQVFEENSQTNSATAEHLFNCVKKSFECRGLSFENVIGFASDGCNTMMGSHNSVASRFKNICPGISIFKCICHSLHLCASEACKVLPRGCEDLARNIYNFFKASSKRQHEFQEFQSFLNLEIHKMLHPAQTRWLSLNAVVVRVIEQWKALELYFINKLFSERLQSVSHIVNALRDPLIELHYLFLEWVLPKFTHLNQLFQSEKPAIALLYELMSSTYKELLKCYIDRNYVNKTRIEDLDPFKKDQFLPQNQIYLGIKVTNYLNKPEINANINLKKDFINSCVQFLSTGYSQIKQRFDFGNVILQNMSVFKPSNAMSEKTRTLIPSLVLLMDALPRLVCSNKKQLIDDEWRKLPNFELPSHINITDNVDIFWHNLLNCGESDQSYYSFKNLSEFALKVISLPHSNAACERIFSAINLVKTKTRNKIVSSTMNGILLSKQRIGNDCVSFEPTKDDYRKMTSAILYPKNGEAQKNCNKKTSSVLNKGNSSQPNIESQLELISSDSDDDNFINVKNFK